MGYVHALQEMLFRENKGTLYLLPACPERLAKGKIERFCFVDGQVRICWDWKASFLEAEFSFRVAGEWKVVLPEFCEKQECTLFINGQEWTEALEKPVRFKTRVDDRVRLLIQKM